MKTNDLQTLIHNYPLEIQRPLEDSKPLTFIFKDYTEPELCDGTFVVAKVKVKERQEEELRQEYGYIFNHFQL